MEDINQQNIAETQTPVSLSVLKASNLVKKYKKRIVEVEKVPRKTKKQIHTMNTIQDLIRLSKKLKQPVKYCVIHEHSKCQFFIEHEKKLYTYIIKEVDLEAKD